MSTTVLSCAQVFQAPYKELLQLKELPMRNESTYITLDYSLLPQLHSPAHSIRIHVIDICILRSIIYMVTSHRNITLSRKDNIADFRIPPLLTQRKRRFTHRRATTTLAASRGTLHTPAQWCRNTSTVMRERIGGRGAAL